MRWFKYRIKIIVFVIIFWALIITSSLFPILKSYVIMSVYSRIHEKSSFLYEENIKIQIPGGITTQQKDYYPFVIAFDPSEAFSRFVGEDIDLTIYYNFGAFDLRKGNSLLYDRNSPYYSSFYGAYAVRHKDGADIYGLTDINTPDIEAITQITDFDLKYLVYQSIGNMEAELKYNIREKNTIKVIDEKEFIVFDASIQMYGMWHEYLDDYRAYIQYGKPSFSLNEKDILGDRKKVESFEEIEGYGRIYLHYDQEDHISYFFYIITADEDTLDYTEKEFIMKSKILKKD